jgi:uncharacterized protein with HEPN domain
VHDSLGIDRGEVWAMVERDLPALKKEILKAAKPLPKRLRKE